MKKNLILFKKKKKFDTQNYKKTFLIRIIELLIKIYKYSSNLLHNNDFKNENRSSYYSSISFIDKPKFFVFLLTFQKNLTEKLEKKNILVRYKSDNIKTDYFIIIGSTLKSFFWLLRMKFQG